MKAIDFIRTFFLFLGGCLGAFLGGLDGFLQTLIIMVVLDYITGVINAWKKKMLSSEIGFWGILKKIIIFVVVGIAYTIDTKVIGTGATLRGAVILFYISNEGLSLLENVASIGVKLPKKLLDVLAQLDEGE